MIELDNTRDRPDTATQTTANPAATDTAAPTKFSAQGAIPSVAGATPPPSGPSASDRAFGPAAAVNATQTQWQPPPGTTPAQASDPNAQTGGWITNDGPQQIPGGPLGKTVTVDAATASAHVDLATPAEAVVTSCDANVQPTFSITVDVPLSQIKADAITPDKLAQLSAVHLSTGAGAGGTVSYQLGAASLRITLSGAPSTSVINATNFKLLLGASGESVMLGVHAHSFHCDVTEFKRAELRNYMASDQRFIDSAKADGDTSPSVAAAQQRLLGYQQQLATMTGPIYVTLDDHGFELKPVAPVAAP